MYLLPSSNSIQNGFSPVTIVASPHHTLHFASFISISNATITPNTLTLQNPIQHHPPPPQINHHSFYVTLPPPSPTLSPTLPRHRLHSLHQPQTPLPSHNSLHGHRIRPCLVPVFPFQLHTLRIQTQPFPFFFTHQHLPKCRCFMQLQCMLRST